MRRGGVRRWWCEAMLDTDPSGDRFTVGLNGTLPTKSVAAAIARRLAAGLPVE
ncbi:hypothetical protein [Streptomyces botrytidirepellens]|uniref:hypothetical protein n=1 Tax=Streptomyces botrytidirepellens TaxID=2486417 RepID=UPI001610257E|nr:hypothetical protein [Streptomyces botrytidirepellens]